MLDLLVIWGHSSDDSISNPQVWINIAVKSQDFPSILQIQPLVSLRLLASSLVIIPSLL